MSLNLRFAVSFIDLFITLQYAVFHKSLSTFHVYIFIMYVYIYIMCMRVVCICVSLCSAQICE